MDIVDLTQEDPQLAEALEVLAEASSVDDPMKIQTTFSKSMQALAGAEAFLGISVRNMPLGHFKVTRAFIGGKPLGNGINPWDQWNSLPTFSGGVIGELITQPFPKIAHALSLGEDPAIPEAFHKYRSAFAVPLLDNGSTNNWSITFRSEPNWPLDIDRLRDFTIRANMIGNTVNLLVTKQRLANLNARLADQLQQVAMLQKSLLPQKTPSVDGLGIATSYLTSNEAGGDYYDFFDMGDGRFGILIADVSGHGAGAATVVAMLRTILHGFQDRHKGPAAMLAHANRELLRNDLGSNFITAFLSVFNADRTRVEYANAGHNLPIVRLPDGSTFMVEDARSLPLGIINDIEYEQAATDTLPGASVVLYTDGIVEAAPHGEKRNQFGDDRLMQAVGTSSGEPFEVINTIHDQLFQHTSLRSREDDQTIVVIHHHAS